MAAVLTGYAAAVDRAFLGGIALGLTQALAVFTLGSGLKNVAALSVLLVFLQAVRHPWGREVMGE